MLKKKKLLRIICLCLFLSGMIFSGVFMQKTLVLHAATQFMNYFKDTPIIGSLSSSCWGAKEVGPRDQSNGLEDKTMSQWAYWDGGIIKGSDGIYHMFASRWNQSAGHNGWFGSVAVHATSTNLYGPYTDQGVCWPDNQGGKGHNVFPFQMKDGRYAVLTSDTRPGDLFTSDSLNGPWTYAGKLSVTGSYASSFSMYNVCIMVRPDWRYEAIQRNGAIGVSDNVLGPYNVSGPPVWNQVSNLPKDNMEDPVMWYSGGLYHATVNKWDTRKAYHLTSADGINNWKLDTGYAYDPIANFIHYTDGTVNHWNKMERPNVYMENGHVIAMTFAVIDVAKDADVGNDKHGSKVIVVPFDGASLDSGSSTSTTSTNTSVPTVTPTNSTPNSTVTPGDSYIRLCNAATGLYIDGTGSTSNGSNACQSSNNSSNNQQWKIINSGDYIMIQNRGTGLYLDGMGSTSNGSICGQWSNSGSANQQWTQETTGNNVRFKNRATGLYLDGMGSTSNGSNLCQWGNSGSNNQQWQIQQ